jgi:hypothetical protein
MEQNIEFEFRTGISGSPEGNRLVSNRKRSRSGGWLQTGTAALLKGAGGDLMAVQLLLRNVNPAVSWCYGLLLVMALVLVGFCVRGENLAGGLGRPNIMRTCK